LRKNGVDITSSSGVISLQGNSPAYMMAVWNYLIELIAGDIIELYWASADINMSIISETAQTSPFAHPAIQSTILTVTQQSGIMAGTGITAINSLTGAVQTLSTGTTGTDFAIVSTGTTHTFNLPTASASNTGKLSSTDWSTFNNKQNNLKTFNRTQGIYYFEEFMGNQGGSVTSSYGQLITVASGNASARTTSTTNRTNQQGIISHSTGTILATNFAGYIYGGASLYLGTGAISLETYVTVETLSTVTERFFTYFGYATNSNYQNNSNGVFFSYDEGGTLFFAATPTPNWKCYTRGTAGTVTMTTTSVAVNVNQWYKLRIDINAAATSVTFYIDGTLVATHSTNIPASTTAMSVVSLINKTVGSTARTMLTDYFMYEEIFTNPR
jgi:hypothetical protein